MADKKLKNIYTNELVYCKDLTETFVQNDITFIRVHSVDNPNREYLVNKAAFELV